jgi:hypothetical protein
MSILTASAGGALTGYFDIPSNSPAGAKTVDLISTASTAATTLAVVAQTTFLSRGVITNREVRRISTTDVRQSFNWVGDPVAQTFILPEDRMCCGASLAIANRGNSQIMVVIRECENGWPTQRFVCGAVNAWNACTLTSQVHGAGTQWTNFIWEPVRLEAHREYALTVMSDDADAAVRIAQMGQTDRWNPGNRVVATNPYLVGVLLTSANNLTWTPHQNADLAFRLLEARFTPVNSASGLVTKTQAFTSVSVTSADYLIVNAAVERPMPDTDVQFELKLYPDSATTAVYSVTEGQPLLLPAQYSGVVDWQAVMQGDNRSTPILHKDVQLISGKGRDTGVYISRGFLMGATSATSSRMTVNLTARLPSGSSLTVRAQTGLDASNMPIYSGAFGESETPVGLQDNWFERTYTASSFTNADSRLYISLSGTARARPEIKALQVITMAV